LERPPFDRRGRRAEPRVRGASALRATVLEPRAALWFIARSTAATHPTFPPSLRAEFDALVAPYFSANIVRQDYLLTRATAR
jgi:hypothetical protein